LPGCDGNPRKRSMSGSHRFLPARAAYCRHIYNTKISSVIAAAGSEASPKSSNLQADIMCTSMFENMDFFISLYVIALRRASGSAKWFRKFCDL
jgi:hypothetical protein